MTYSIQVETRNIQLIVDTCRVKFGRSSMTRWWWYYVPDMVSSYYSFNFVDKDDAIVFTLMKKE